MAALTASTFRDIKLAGTSLRLSWRVDNAAVIWAGAWTAVPGTNALTADRGYLVEWQNEINLLWAGMAVATSATNNLGTDNSVTGDTAASPVVEMSTEAAPFILVRGTVTGVSAQTDVGRTAVYASNDNDLTTTANQAPDVGRVQYWYSSTTADVFFYGVVAQWATA